jgi:DNA-dependent protein kinase catalytic subunit
LNLVNKTDRATVAFRKWLEKLEPGGKLNDQHIIGLGVKSDKLCPIFFNTGATRYYLREGFKSMCETPELFISRREAFLQSYIPLCIASYILGIGDRHLENFLISLTTGCVYGIDFGIAFDNGIHLAVPELIPFRLTPQIRKFMEPYKIQGYMKRTLSTLRNNKELILDACEIFVKEPLLEWVKEAQKQNKDSEEDEEDRFGKVKKEDEYEQIKWYPQKKMDRMRDKLEGKNSAQIMMKEISDSIHYHKDYLPQLK